MNMSINVRETTPEGGATELWPGSHKDTAFIPTGPGAPSEEAIAARLAAGHGPTQVYLPKGAVLLRDVRAWHRGVPNSGSVPRHMLFVGYASVRLRPPLASGISGGQGSRRFASGRFSSDCRPCFSRDRWPLGAFEAVHGTAAQVEHDIEYLDEPVDHYGNVASAGVQRSPKGPDDHAFWVPESDGSWFVALDSAERDALPEWVKAAVAAWHARRPSL